MVLVPRRLPDARIPRPGLPLAPSPLRPVPQGVRGRSVSIAAHPDDENTQLITYLARGRGSRMAYLSVTRGDGGQNLYGPEFGGTLGVIRTQELLSAAMLTRWKLASTTPLNATAFEPRTWHPATGVRRHPPAACTMSP